MTNFREFFQRKIKNIVWPSFNMMKSSGKLNVLIAEPEVYGNPDASNEACFKISYDNVNGLPQEVFFMSTDCPEPSALKTLEDLTEQFDKFYNSIHSRIVSVSVHLEMDTFCMHGVEKETNNV